MTMKRYLPFLVLLLFASPGGDPPPPPVESAVFCEEWLHFSDGSVAVCTTEDSLVLRER